MRTRITVPARLWRALPVILRICGGNDAGAHPNQIDVDTSLAPRSIMLCAAWCAAPSPQSGVMKCCVFLHAFVSLSARPASRRGAAGSVDPAS